MTTIDDLLPSSDSENDNDENEEEEEMCEQKVQPFLSQGFVEVAACCPQPDVKYQSDLPLFKRDASDLCHSESLWKPNITERVKTGPKLTSMDDAMDKERYLLRKVGQDELADLLYNKRDIIKKHIQNAEEIIFNEDEDISSVQCFIEERYRLHFGLDKDGHARKLSEEEGEERDFLIDHSVFIARVILRMHNLEPDDYKGKIENFHMAAKLEVFREEKLIRDRELEAMDKERQRIFFARHKAKSEQLARARAGEESSDDDVDDVEGSSEEESDRQAEIENELMKKMNELQLDINPEQVAKCVSKMMAEMKIRPALHDRERASSPPRQPEFSDDDKPIIDLPWSNEGEIDGDEILDDTEPVEEIDLTEFDDKKHENAHEILFDWSEDIFPDEENIVLGGKRPLDVLDTLEFHPKRRAVEKDGHLEQKPIDTAPPPLRLRSCLAGQHELPTDNDEMKLSVKERIKWREAFESHSKKKKVVRFVEFDDPRNKCRFYLRPIADDRKSFHFETENQLKDITKQAQYMDCSLSSGHQYIRNHMMRTVPGFASNSHSIEEYKGKLAKYQNGTILLERYSVMHPDKFLRPDARELKTPNGIHLPAYPGKNDPHVINISIKSRALLLRDFRLAMRQFRQNRSGISLVHHLDDEVQIVAGILMLSDGLLKDVEEKKLSNTVLQRFHASQGIEDILDVVDRCSYEELEIRHCVLAWGHDLIAYFLQNPIVAAGRAAAALVHLRTVLERKKYSFEQEGYRRRELPVFWLITIPEIGDFAKHFVIYNKVIRTLFYNHAHFHILDWALAVDRCKRKEKRRSLYTKVAVEERLTQLFDLCRQELDLTYFRCTIQKNRDRQISWEKKDYDCDDN